MQINKQQFTKNAQVRFYLFHFPRCHPLNRVTQMERTAPVPVLWNTASSKMAISTQPAQRIVNKLKTLHNLLHLDDSLNLLPVSVWKRTRPWTADKKGQIWTSIFMLAQLVNHRCGWGNTLAGCHRLEVFWVKSLWRCLSKISSPPCHRKCVTGRGIIYDRPIKGSLLHPFSDLCFVVSDSHGAALNDLLSKNTIDIQKKTANLALCLQPAAKMLGLAFC